VIDGSEDANLNGVVDNGETDPTEGHGDDDGSVVDTDGDGLSDILETSIGTNPNDPDSDDDGVSDGAEANPADDADGDGIINALDSDSDNDGLFDGTEMGKDCSGAGTEAAAEHCIPDGDGGATTTSPLDPDTDHGGIKDGDEDKDKDGVVDPGEKDPNDKADDSPANACDEDSDCGGAMSALVCDGSTQTCVPGCRGTGNRCPSGETCSSSDDTVGQCVPDSSSSGGSDEWVWNVFDPSSCACSVQASSGDRDIGWTLLAGALGVALARRRRRVASAR
jgi:clumping factor A